MKIDKKTYHFEVTRMNLILKDKSVPPFQKLQVVSQLKQLKTAYKQSIALES